MRPHLSDGGAGEGDDFARDLRETARRILVVSDHFDRLRQLGRAILETGCRVELSGRAMVDRGEQGRGRGSYALIALDALGAGPRFGQEILDHVRWLDDLTPIVVVTQYRAARASAAGPGVRFLSASLTADGLLQNPDDIVRSLCATWAEFQPRSGPGGLCVDAVANRVTARGRELSLTPLEYRLLRALVEQHGAPCTFAALRRAGWQTSAARDRRSVRAVRRGIARLRLALAVTDAAIETLHGIGYRLTSTRDTRS
jgi:DNA-binding response OmpR family regulator